MTIAQEPPCPDERRQIEAGLRELDQLTTQQLDAVGQGDLAAVARLACKKRGVLTELPAWQTTWLQALPASESRAGEIARLLRRVKNRHDRLVLAVACELEEARKMLSALEAGRRARAQYAENSSRARSLPSFESPP